LYRGPARLRDNAAAMSENEESPAPAETAAETAFWPQAIVERTDVRETVAGRAFSARACWRLQK